MIATIQKKEVVAIKDRILIEMSIEEGDGLSSELFELVEENNPLLHALLIALNCARDKNET